ncbi:MAG: hypothetical protein PHE17_09245 [Thiothrix sp.]|uniref:hypothetical protein n=1 Tax=Thiothrix sp. TaxID=1032 RepID=UPI00260B12AD|nr:hypothetical protein [Thiothrix sp.]MDD5393190.1 hypothetical protein [Thiothrix sp.]
MKKYEITFSTLYPETPLTFWVHVPKVKGAAFDVNNYEPPLSRLVGGKGFPVLRLYFLGIELRFSSLHEISHFTDVLDQKNLPTSISLSLKRNAGVGPNGHWLSRLPAKLKPWKQRVKLVQLLKLAKADFASVFL